jgi:hypothetical protein
VFIATYRFRILVMPNPQKNELFHV